MTTINKNKPIQRPWRITRVTLSCQACGSDFVVHRYLQHRAKACSQSCARRLQRGPAAARWKGGTTIRPDGYRMVYDPTHPNTRRSPASRGIYVQEHRKVAAEIVGRPLLESEVVHHKNGIKTDNRPENLVVLASSSEHARMHVAKGKKGFIGHVDDLDALLVRTR